MRFQKPKRPRTPTTASPTHAAGLPARGRARRRRRVRGHRAGPASAHVAAESADQPAGHGGQRSQHEQAVDRQGCVALAAGAGPRPHRRLTRHGPSEPGAEAAVRAAASGAHQPGAARATGCGLLLRQPMLESTQLAQRDCTASSRSVTRTFKGRRLDLRAPRLSSISVYILLWAQCVFAWTKFQVRMSAACFELDCLRCLECLLLALALPHSTRMHCGLWRHARHDRRHRRREWRMRGKWAESRVLGGGVCGDAEHATRTRWRDDSYAPTLSSRARARAARSAPPAAAPRGQERPSRSSCLGWRSWPRSSARRALRGTRRGFALRAAARGE